MHFLFFLLGIMYCQIYSTVEFSSVYVCNLLYASLFWNVNYPKKDVSFLQSCNVVGDEIFINF